VVCREHNIDVMITGEKLGLAVKLKIFEPVGESLCRDGGENSLLDGFLGRRDLLEFGWEREMVQPDEWGLLGAW
jgi:hypothetical protein